MPAASARVLINTNHRDRCQRSMFVARDEHEEAKIIPCPLPDCNNVWCKQCQQTIEFGGPKHSCDGTTELDHLMKQQGWKYCPCMSVLDPLVAAIIKPVLSSVQDTDSESLRVQPYVGKFYSDLALIRRSVTYSRTVYDPRMQYVSANYAPLMPSL